VRRVHPRESIGRRLGRSITADGVVAALDEACHRRGAPEFIRCDNGPELVATAIKDWCRLVGTGTAYMEPGSPWQNPFVESFNGKDRDELFAREIFDSIFEARVPYEDWCNAYNRVRPHSRLGYCRPTFSRPRHQPRTLTEGGPVNGDRSSGPEAMAFGCGSSSPLDEDP
jgi:putative transposase